MGSVIDPAPAPRVSARSAHNRLPISLIVIRDDPRAAAQARAAYAANPSDAPHYYIDATGDVTQFAPEERVTQHSGSAAWQKHRRNIDRISVAIALEHSNETDYSDALLVAVHDLLDAIERRHHLNNTAIVRWESTPERGERIGRVMPFFPPQPAMATTEEAPLVLGVEADVDPATKLWSQLAKQTFSQRGGVFKDTAFNYHAARFDLGAPMAPNLPNPITLNGKVYNYQTFAHDTIFNEGSDWGAVQSLNTILGDEVAMPEGGLARALLEASYAASLKVSASKVALTGTQDFRPDWAFHYIAAKEHLGPALSGNGYTDDQQYIRQVFAGDTLYSPATEQAGCKRLSQALPDDPAYALLWAETYKLCGLPYDPNSPFQQRAVQDDLGTPLTGVYQVDLDDTSYQVQVFGLDTLYAGPDSVIKRQSELPKQQDVQNWQPKPVTAPPPPQLRPTIAASAPSADPNWPPRPSFACLPSQSARQQAFGAFSYVPSGNGNIRITDGWAAQNIIEVNIPQLAGISGAPGSGTIQFHKRAADQLRAMWAAWEAAGLMHLVLNWQGSFVPRFIRGSSTQLSNHAFGSAFDINAAWNGWYAVPALIGQKGCVRELVQIANQHGFYWGGHFAYGKGLSDGMHFEWAIPI